MNIKKKNSFEFIIKKMPKINNYKLLLLIFFFLLDFIIIKELTFLIQKSIRIIQKLNWI
jgi:hypothetical protein